MVSVCFKSQVDWWLSSSLLFFPLQTDVPTSGTCSALLGFDKNRKAQYVFCQKSDGQWAVVMGSNSYHGKEPQTLKRSCVKSPAQQPLMQLPGGQKATWPLLCTLQATHAWQVTVSCPTPFHNARTNCSILLLRCFKPKCRFYKV